MNQPKEPQTKEDAEAYVGFKVLKQFNNGTGRSPVLKEYAGIVTEAIDDLVSTQGIPYPGVYYSIQ